MTDGSSLAGLWVTAIFPEAIKWHVSQNPAEEHTCWTAAPRLVLEEGETVLVVENAS